MAGTLFVGTNGQVGRPDRDRPIQDKSGVEVAATATEINAMDPDDAEAVTATSDGTGTGVIAGGKVLDLVAVTSASANNIVTLPAPVPGTTVMAYVGANGYELRSSAPATVLIGGGSGGAAVESAIPANSLAVVMCISATSWVGYTITGATLAAIEAAA